MLHELCQRMREFLTNKRITNRKNALMSIPSLMRARTSLSLLMGWSISLNWIISSATDGSNDLPTATYHQSRQRL
jgi:hypothetical protein